MMAVEFALIIPGEPVGAGRPRFARMANGGVTTRTPDKTRSYAERVQTEWIAAGRPTLEGAGAWLLDVVAVFARPRGHFRQDGTLSAAGVRAPLPTKKPDGDQILKAVTDPLVAIGAVPDDAACVRWALSKRWALNGEAPYVRVAVEGVA